MTRRLRLDRETLAELTSDELGAVAGGVTLTGYYPTLIPFCTNTIYTGEVAR